jgi:hypothetical protein
MIQVSLAGACLSHFAHNEAILAASPMIIPTAITIGPRHFSQPSGWRISALPSCGSSPMMTLIVSSSPIKFDHSADDIHDSNCHTHGGNGNDGPE